MLPEDSQTIAAISTAPGVGAIGVVRLSGPEAFQIADRLFVGKRKVSQMAQRTLQPGRIVRDGRVLDQVVLSVMHAPDSYTGEDVVEISCHGNPLILRDVLDAVIAAGARLATGGEFTRRAFIHGKIDLCQAEAVIELLTAKTDQAKQVALAQLQGKTSEKIATLRRSLIRAKAILDASIDFPEDVPDEAEVAYEQGCQAPTADGTLRSLLASARNEVERMIAAFDRGQRLRDAPHVAIIGKANVGKSTLLNSLLGEERVITSSEPGTTRDRVEAQLVLPSGQTVRISDTAGMLGRPDDIGQKAGEMAERAAASADLLVAVFDASCELDAEDDRMLKRWANRPAVLVCNKIDLGEMLDKSALQASWGDGAALATLETCATKGWGVEALKLAIDSAISDLLPKIGPDDCIAATLRNKQLLLKAKRSLVRAEEALSANPWPEFASRDIEDAIEAFNETLGVEVGVDILDEIFSRFCIGK